MSQTIRIGPLSEEQRDELEKLYRTTRGVRIQTGAQIVLLVADKGWTASLISEVVRHDEIQGDCG